MAASRRGGRMFPGPSFVMGWGFELGVVRVAEAGLRGDGVERGVVAAVVVVVVLAGRPMARSLLASHSVMEKWRASTAAAVAGYQFESWGELEDGGLLLGLPGWCSGGWYGMRRRKVMVMNRAPQTEWFKGPGGDKGRRIAVSWRKAGV